MVLLTLCTTPTQITFSANLNKTHNMTSNQNQPKLIQKPNETKNHKLPKPHL